MQLRIKTEYSFGATYAPLGRVVQRLKEIGCTHAAITDEGGTWGHVPWHAACREAGIVPILGVELVVSDVDDVFPRMVLLARNATGLREVYRLSSLAHRQKIASRAGSLPRLYTKDLVGHSDDIVVLAGDVTDEDTILATGALVDLSPASRILNMAKQRVADKHNLGTVRVSDNAYAYPEDREAFEFLNDRGLKPTPQHILDDIEVDHWWEATFEDYELPKAPMIRADGNLEQLCREGIRFRGMEESWSEAYEQRLRYELDLIQTKDFDSYFIIVADMMTHAKQHMLVGPARGSSAGSLVCYLTRITEIDPIQHGLFFERFIDISRSDLPDIDTDFPDEKRHIVFEYMAEKYGSTNTAHIGTISTFKPKSALVQVCKRLGIPAAATGAVKVAMIERSSADSRANNCLEDTLRETEPGKKLLEMYPQVMVSARLEGHASHTGVHAAGLLVANVPIEHYCTVTELGIAQIEKGSAETLGLLKIDVLGLRTLGILEDSGVDVDWYNLPTDDPATYAVFNSQKFCGVFQFEGNALRAVSSRIQFKSIDEIDAVTALARPGPFGGGVTEEYCARDGGKSYVPMHPLIHAQLKDTYGLPVYQEQIMNIVRHVGKFDWKETSVIRKAMSKRMGAEFFSRSFEKFKVGAGEQGIGEQEAREAWDMINSFGAWAFNKAHSRSYAFVSYWTAWLKAHHPLEFAAANLRNAKDDDSALELLREMYREGLQYVPFDPYLSEATWSVKDGKLVAGFDALKGFGAAKAAKFVAARAEGKLTAEMIQQAREAENIFADLFPFDTKYQSIYADPKAHGIGAGKVWKVGELTEGIPHGEERVFIAELIHKNQRDINEAVNVKKRGGKVERGPAIFVDMRLRDDSGMIGGRINRFDYARIGKELLEEIPIGAHLLVRAKFFNGIRYAFVSKYKLI